MNDENKNLLLFPTRSSLKNNIIWIASVALFYFVMARVSLVFLFEPEDIAAIWPPAGIFLSSILLTRRNLRPWLVGVLFIVEFISERMAGTEFVISLIYALALTGDAVLSAWLLLRFIGESITFNRIRELTGWLLLSVIFSNSLAALFVAAANSWMLPGTSFWDLWFKWMASDGIGNIVVTPLILSWADWIRNQHRISLPKNGWEFPFIFILMAFVGYLYYTNLSTHSLYSVILPYLVFPFLLWGGMRFGVLGAATTAFFLAILAILFLTGGTVTDDLFHEPILYILIITQLFLAIMIVPSLFLGTVVTERQMAMKKLRESEDKFKYFFDYSIIGNSIILPSGVFQGNYELSKMLGYSREELQDKRWQDISHPDDESISQGEIKSLLSGKKDAVRYSKRLIKKDGSILWADIGTSLRKDEAGSGLYLISSIIDTTERRLKEAQIKLQAAALASTANAIVITDRNGTIEWTNPAFSLLTGYTSEEVIGQNLRILKSGEQDRLFYQKLWDTLLSGQVWHSELVNKRKDGSFYHEEETTTPLRNSQGEISKFISVKQDITQRKQNEAALLKHLQLEAQMAALGRELAKSRDLPKICRQAYHNFKQMTSSAYFTIVLLKKDENALKMLFAASEETEFDVTSYPLLEMSSKYATSVYLEPILSRAPLIITNPPESPDWPAAMRKYRAQDMRSACCLPMLAEDQVIGLIMLQGLQENDYKPEDLEWLSVVANQVGLNIQNALLFTRIQHRIAELSSLATIDSAVISHCEPQEMYDLILEQVITRLHIDAATLFLFRPEKQQLDCVSERGYIGKEILKQKPLLGESLTGKVAQGQQILHQNMTFSTSLDLLTDEAKKEGFVDYYGAPLVADAKLIGVLELFHRSQTFRDRDWLDFLKILANQAAVAIQTIQLNHEIMLSNDRLLQAYDLTIEGWSRAMDLRDKETENHTQRVTELTLRLAKHLGVSDDQMIHLRRGALLHDIGKLGVPDEILLKAEGLTEDEWIVMRNHPQYAYDMLNQIEYLHPALDIPYCHHEKWDGTGYPRRLKGEEIPFTARIFALADVYDALTSARPYRAAWSRERAINLIREQSGKHFDPRVVEAFLSLWQTGTLS